MCVRRLESINAKVFLFSNSNFLLKKKKGKVQTALPFGSLRIIHAFSSVLGHLLVISLALSPRETVASQMSLLVSKVS